MPSLDGIELKPMVLLPTGSLQPANLADGIAALCMSVAAVVGGVALICVTWGTATPGVVAAWGALGGATIGTGLAGTVNASTGIHTKRFDCWG